MGSCEQYQQLIFQNPLQLSPETSAHVEQCARCKAAYKEALQHHRQSKQAEHIEAPTKLVSSVKAIPSQQRNVNLAFLLLLIILFFSIYLASQFTTDLPGEVLAHIENEPDAFISKQPVSKMDTKLVLNKVNLNFNGNTPLITFAENCPMLGQFTAHLVTLGQKGPVTMLFTNETIKKSIAIKNARFDGKLIPLYEGSIAIVGEKGESLQPMIDWATQTVTRY